MLIVNARHLTVRNLPESLAIALDGERRRRGVSLNQTVLDLLSQSLGVGVKRSNGLARLAGAWSDQDFQEFLNNTTSLNEPDPELWQ